MTKRKIMCFLIYFKINLTFLRRKLDKDTFYEHQRNLKEVIKKAQRLFDHEFEVLKAILIIKYPF